MSYSEIHIHSSYQRHIEDQQQALNLMQLPSCFQNKNTIDEWRHNRMHNMLSAIIDTDAGAKWLTLGDGRYGSDAFFLQRKGLEVTASSISDETLQFAVAKGLIKNAKALNAEAIDEPDSSYDYILCKEAFHHFPRPPVAFYEMLRVTRKAVILIEPQEDRNRILNLLRHLFKKIVRKDESLNFEKTGNYIYRINIREISKQLTCLNYQGFAYKRFNDFYLSALGHKSQNHWLSMNLTRMGVFLQNLLCKFRLLDYGLAVLIIFKSEPTDEMQSKLKSQNFKNVLLPKNPYVD